METKPKSFDCFCCDKPHSAEFPTMVCDMCALDFAAAFNKMSVIQELSEIAYLTKNFPVKYKDVRASYVWVKLHYPDVDSEGIRTFVFLAIKCSIENGSTPFIEVSKNLLDIVLKDFKYEQDLEKTKEWLKNFTALPTISVKANFNGFTDLPIM